MVVIRLSIYLTASILKYLENVDVLLILSKVKIVIENTFITITSVTQQQLCFNRAFCHTDSKSQRW